MSTLLDQSEALFEAIQAHDLKKAKLLLKNGADPNRLLLKEITPFHVAAKVSSSFVNLMLMFEGNPNVPDVDGITPCHVAAQWGKADCLNLLLHNGGDLFLTDERGRDLKWFSQDNDFCKSILEEHIADAMERREDNSSLDSKVECDNSVQFVQPIYSSHHLMHRPCTENIQRISSQKENNTFCQRGNYSKGPPLKEHSDYNVTPIKPGSRVVRNCALDATSPDNCFFVLKSSENKRVSLNQTIKMLSHGNQTMPWEGKSDPDLYGDLESSSNNVRRQLFCTEQNISSYNACQSVSQSNSSNQTTETHSGENDIAFADSTIPIGESTETTDHMLNIQPCKRFSSEYNLNACDQAVDRASREESDFTFANSTIPIEGSIEKTGQFSTNKQFTSVYDSNSCDRVVDRASQEESDFTFAESTVPINESVEKTGQFSNMQPCKQFTSVCDSNSCNRVVDWASQEESDFTFADSTVPVEGSVEKNLSKLSLNCQATKGRGILGDLSAERPTGEVHSNLLDLTDDGQNKNHLYDQQSLSPMQDTLLSCNTSSSGSIGHENEDSGRVVYETNGYSLIEFASSPSTSVLSIEEGNITVPLQLSCSIDNSLNDTTILYDWKMVSNCSTMEEVNCTYYSQDETPSLPSRIENMGDDELQQNLLKHGFTPGPIRHGRKVYKKRLHLFEQGIASKPTQDRPELNYSRELRTVLLGEALDKSVVDDDVKLRKEFDDPHTNQCYRGWAAKDSFNYLLLDPRVTKNLPERAKSFSDVETLKIFAGAIFYIGKGKKSRPYAHFKEALQNVKMPASKKIQHIHDIWNKNHGVVSLHIFQNVVDHEAFTREAAMIDAFGLDHLTNCKRGKRYGIAANWDRSRVCRYGTYLILAAMQIFLLDGERQIRPHQVTNKKTFCAKV